MLREVTGLRWPLPADSDAHRLTWGQYPVVSVLLLSLSLVTEQLNMLDGYNIKAKTLRIYANIYMYI